MKHNRERKAEWLPLLAAVLGPLLILLALSFGTRRLLAEKPEPVCEHIWEDGVCTVCGAACGHSWEDGVCAVCGAACEHSWEDGVCAVCGAACEHNWEEGVCTVCGAVCRHEAHERNTRACLVCGQVQRHHYVNDVCAGCGRAPVLYDGRLPDRYFQPAEHQGSCIRDTYRVGQYNFRIAAWLPYDYNEDTKYNVVIMLHGDNGMYHHWAGANLRTDKGQFNMTSIYDHMVEEQLCEPFIVVSIDTYMFKNTSVGVRHLREGLLPYLARTFSTWAEDDSAEAIVAAREHFALGGQSRGSVFTYTVGMQYCLDMIGNFCCFGNAGDMLRIARVLNSETFADYPVNCYYATWGAKDREDYRDVHKAGFNSLVEQADCLVEGENAFGREIDSGHDWITWSTSMFNALQMMF